MSEVSVIDAIGAALKPGMTRVQEIVALNVISDKALAVSDQAQFMAAERIVAELAEPGVTERAVAKAINKSPAHVHHTKRAYLAAMEMAEEDRPEWHVLYKAAKAPKTQPAITGEVETSSYRDLTGTETKAELTGRPVTNTSDEPAPDRAPDLHMQNVPDALLSDVINRLGNRSDAVQAIREGISRMSAGYFVTTWKSMNQ